ncbi:DNA double-strand break repair nuclease NurA [Halodesulfurarchaeum sp. HSR-GB]|uniref:DNA double-strand break repair nuclease NurA n=1 Tax=Halodesulfurarchaeum sp. HSR-GB TaxID=3074077 RepID=UPI002855DC95|nr:DNA double-strand break repair nuclease NurA [Halodesulfurarchaeum sp. HSR-GB]MDR5656240.1 DNA double-strand break repair nuclease NurA [Halodesulfurarchaeum sp. HSR-GB]
MTIDPVHYDGIAALASRIRHDADPEAHRDLAETVWAEHLDPLRTDGDPVLEPIESVTRRAAPIDDLALQQAPFETAHGLDSGTINPTTFKNGLLLDLAQAAMAAVPSDLDLHRARTYIMPVHSNDASVNHGTDGWDPFDEDHGRGRIVQTEALARDEERIVHGLALYLAESHHALEHAHRVEDVLFLDGPLYPKGLLHWRGRHGSIAELAGENDLVAEVLENYVALVETFLEREIPLVGFVKSPQSRGLIRALAETGRPSPWASDTAFFSQVLEQREGGGRRNERVTDQLSWTGWFRSRLGADAVFAGPEADLGVTRDRPAPDYEVAFFVIYDPRTELLFKAELPGGFAEDPAVRSAVEQYVLRGVAAERGPPLPIAKADELARIGSEGKAELVRRLEVAFDTSEDRNYDAERWGPEF